MTWKRVATAAVLIPFAAGLVIWGPTWALALAVALVMLLALFEYFALGDAIGHRAYRFWTAACALILVFFQFWTTTLPSVDYIGATGEGSALRQWMGRYAESNFRFPSPVGDVFFIFLLGVTVLTLWTKRPMVEALPAAGISSSGLILVALPLTFAIRLHGIPSLGPALLFFALVITWVGDSAAYFVGRAIGKHKFAPILSPNKSWEGSAASILGALLVAFVFARYVNIPLPHFLTMAVVGNIAGQAGDLLESAYKRSAGVKDSGSLLPGHGGVLDRIDALILAIPVVWYYWIWIYLPNR